MANYYYFASDEEHQYALEHGFVGDTLKSVGKFVKTTANKISLNRKRKKIEKTPVKIESDFSEARSDRAARASTSRKEKVWADMASDAKSASNKRAAMSSKAAVRNNAVRNSQRKTQTVTDNTPHAYGHENKNFGSRYGSGSTPGVTRSHSADPHAYNSTAQSAVSRYRAQHPRTKLSDAQIIKNLGLTGSRETL